MAKGPEGRSARVDALSAIGGGLITGFAVGLSVMFLERGFVAAGASRLARQCGDR